MSKDGRGLDAGRRRRWKPYPRRPAWAPFIFVLAAGLLFGWGGVAWLGLPAEQRQRAVDDARSLDDAAAGETPARAVPTPQAIELHSEWVAQSGNPVISVGETATIEIVFRNTGQIAWVKGTAAEARLGVKNDDPSFAEAGLSVGWLSPVRAAVQSEDVVHPAQTGRFSFQVVGAKPGVFRLHLRLLVEGVTWMEDDGVYVELTVR